MASKNNIANRGQQSKKVFNGKELSPIKYYAPKGGGSSRSYSSMMAAVEKGGTKVLLQSDETPRPFKSFQQG